MTALLIRGSWSHPSSETDCPSSSSKIKWRRSSICCQAPIEVVRSSQGIVWLALCPLKRSYFHRVSTKIQSMTRPRMVKIVAWTRCALVKLSKSLRRWVGTSLHRLKRTKRLASLESTLISQPWWSSAILCPLCSTQPSRRRTNSRLQCSTQWPSKTRTSAFTTRCTPWTRGTTIRLIGPK